MAYGAQGAQSTHEGRGAPARVQTQDCRIWTLHQTSAPLPSLPTAFATVSQKAPQLMSDEITRKLGT